jgi:two-component system, cell cycle sensor histidine kinase and response regulator CckA
MTPQTESSQRPETITAPVHQLASELQILRTELEIQNGKLREAERRERELTEHLREARQLDSLGRLAGGIAHDFNNLLQIISVSLDLLADDSRAEDRVDSLRSARSAIDRATLLTRQIMVYSQRTPVAPVMIELPGLLETISPVLRSFMQGEARLVIDADPEAPGVVADTAQLEQVILNLVVNAADAVGSSGTVLIRTLADRLTPAGPPGTQPRPDQPAVLLEVCDTGSGISPETLARIFEPFFTTKPPGRGTGLGLSLVDAIVARHGGRIEVQSRVGAGTTFQIRWPAAPSAAVRADPPVASSDWGDLGGAVILVAEDDPIIRRILERFLRRRGFEVILATDGAEAVDRFNAHAASGIDLLMFDIEMPKLSGTDAYNVIRHHPACPPVLFVSGVAEEASAPSSPRIRFLRKPYSESDLLATLAALREEAMR